MTGQSGVVRVYESISQPLLSRWQFYQRLMYHVFIAMAVITVSVFVGMLGFMFFEGMAWHDAYLHAALLLGGHGALTAPQSISGKLFVGFYGLYAGLIFVAALGIIFAPVAHRVLHKLHLDEDE